MPCERIHDVTKHLLPTVPHGSKISIGFVEFLATDFRNHKAHLERVAHISFFVETTEILNTHHIGLRLFFSC